jgi:hypothetical protein
MSKETPPEISESDYRKLITKSLTRVSNNINIFHVMMIQNKY